MRKLILSLGFVALAWSVQAQEAEIKATNTAYQVKNYKQAITSAAQAHTKLTADHSVSAEDRATFYFNAAKAAKAGGDILTAAEYFAVLRNLESNPYWKAKNKDTKEYEFFFDKAEGEKTVAAGNYSKLKEAKLDSNRISEVGEELSTEANNALSLANNSFKTKKYETAASKFLEAYYLTKALGNPNEIMSYYAAISYLQTEDKAKAAQLLQGLIDSGFTGVQTQYLAKDKEGKDVSFSSKSDMDTQVKLGLYTQPREEKTESMEEELYSNATYVYYNLKDWDNALKVAKTGLEKYPNNENMNQMLSGIYFETGDTGEFVKNLEEKVAAGTANATDYFNLAKSLEDANGDQTKVKAMYKKAIELNPDFKNAYLNLAYNIITPEKEYVELMNANLGTSAKEKKIYAENAEKRKKLYEEALPYLEKAYKLDKEDITLIKILRNSYDELGMDDEFFEMKKKLDELR